MNKLQKFSFDYKKYSCTALSIEQLDALAAFVVNSGGGLMGAIIAGIKIVAIGAYLGAREKLIRDKIRVARQEYEKALSSTHQDQNEV